MTDLLERWSLIEPKRCRVNVNDYGDMAFWVSIGGDMVLVAHTRSLKATPEERNAVTLGAVIEAIEARGWHWQLSCSPPRDYIAIVWTDDMSVPNSADESPAAALLSAYLDAVEAVS